MKNTMTTRFEEMIIDLYNKNQLSENMLRKLLNELNGYYIDPDATKGIDTNDGKKFKELICYTIEPDTHQEIMDTSRLIDTYGGEIWENMVESEKMFERIWHEDLDVPDSEQAAEKRATA